MELYMTRHGESYGNVRMRNKVDGTGLSEAERFDPLLTDLGRRQAFLLGQRLAPCDFDAVIASPLIRAVETAYEVVCRQGGKSANRMEIMPELMEVGTPEGYMGASQEKIAETFPDLSFNFIATKNPVYPSDLERDRAECMKRTANVIDYIKEKFHGDSKVLLVSHGTFQHPLILAALGLPFLDNFNFCSENTALTKVRYFEDGRIRLSYSGDLSHLIPDFPHHTFSL